MDISLLLFWLKKTVAAFMLPPLLPLVPIALGLALLSRRPRLARVLAWGGVVLNLVLILPASVGWMLSHIEAPNPIAEHASAQAGAIVILGAGRRDYAPEYGGETVNRLSLERLRYGARLARSSGLPILVSGGGAADDVSEAALMADALAHDFGITVQWTEGRSRDTRENASHSAAMLKAAGIHSILLVTHAAHMPRAQAEFEAAGLLVHPAPTAWLGNHDPAGSSDALLGALPSPNSAYAGWFALHETLGALAYRLTR